MQIFYLFIFSNCSKICSNFLFVFALMFKISSILVDLIKFKRSFSLFFVFLHYYSSSSLLKFSAFNGCMCFIICFDHNIFHHIFHNLFIILYQSVSHSTSLLYYFIFFESLNHFSTSFLTPGFLSISCHTSFLAA